ncbi:MAG: DUF1223 domain-containing protein [Candidatus Thiodiazotropha sp. 6PLUC2]
MTARIGLLLLSGMLATASAQATNTLTLSSPVEQVRLVELYTSHGCSSCPPADRWLSKLENHPGLWRQLIPMAFHVDYWDGLGWPDRFASSAFSQRQRDYRHSGALGSVYTPGFVVDGQEWRGWFRHPELAAGKQLRVGRLTLAVDPGAGVSAEFIPEAGGHAKGLQANLAILGFDLVSHIGGGENRGRDLSENFVVLSHSRSESGAETGKWSFSWPEISVNDAKRLAVVVWLSDPETGAPVQAAGGWLPG